MGAFKNLEDLVGDLQAGLVKLRAGELEPEELTPLVDDARELCDRLTLLRFKAHEFAYEVRKKAPEGGVDEAVAERQPVRPFRIGAAYQTSLIDAIEEVSREQAERAADARLQAGTPDLFDAVRQEDAPATLEVEAEDKAEVVETPVVQEAAAVEEPEAPEMPLEEDVVEQDIPDPEPVPEAPSVEASLFGESQATSLAEQMERQPIGNLRTAFSLVEKYECIKGLFQDDALLFDRVLEALDSAGDAQLALHWLQQHVPESKEWDREDPTVMRFLERIDRRYA